MDITFTLFFLLTIIVLFLCFISFNLILILASVILLSISIAFYKGWYIIESVIFKKSRIIEKIGKYELSSDRKVAYLRSKNIIAVAAAKLDTSEITELSKEKLENIISSFHIPFKLELFVKPINQETLINSMLTKRYEKELELQKINQKNLPKIEALKLQIETIKKDIEVLTSGKPIEILFYIFAYSSSSSEIAARSDALIHIRQLVSYFDAATGSKSIILEGNDLANLLLIDSGF
ncbi:MAG: hypothetical protein QXD11_00070 [Candidatus Micrarchaeaceae archaeon]